MTPFNKYITDYYKKEDLVGIEIGLFRGINAVYMLQELPIKMLYLVDNYQPYYDGGSMTYQQDAMNQAFSVATGALEPYKDKVTYVLKDSSAACQDFTNGFFDFVYIDAGHTYDDVMNDMMYWWDKTKSGGVFGGHDYGTVNGAQVKLAVDNFIKIKGIGMGNKSKDFTYIDPDPIPQNDHTFDPSIGLRVGEAMEWAFIKQ